MITAFVLHSHIIISYFSFILQNVQYGAEHETEAQYTSEYSVFKSAFLFTRWLPQNRAGNEKARLTEKWFLPLEMIGKPL